MNYFNHELLTNLLSKNLSEDKTKEFKYKVKEVLENVLKQKDGINSFIQLAELLDFSTYKLLETTYYEDNAEDNNETLGENCEDRLYYYFSRDAQPSFREMRHSLYNGLSKNYDLPKEAKIGEYLAKLENGAKEAVPVEFLPNTSEFSQAILDLANDKKNEGLLTKVIDLLNRLDSEEPIF